MSSSGGLEVWRSPSLCARACSFQTPTTTTSGKAVVKRSLSLPLPYLEHCRLLLVPPYVLHLTVIHGGQRWEMPSGIILAECSTSSGYCMGCGRFGGGVLEFDSWHVSLFVFFFYENNISQHELPIRRKNTSTTLLFCYFFVFSSSDPHVTLLMKSPHPCRIAATDMKVVFPLVLQLPASCLWERIGAVCDDLWRENTADVEICIKGTDSIFTGLWSSVWSQLLWR